MKASDFIIKYLEKKGVRHIFGYTGGAVTHIVDSIYLNGNVRFVSLYNEQAAAFASSAVAKYTSNLAVAVATSGPGITNMITGIAESFFDSTPVLFLAGQVNTYDFKYGLAVRQKGFQETDIVNIVGPITKYCSRIDRPEDVIPELKKAVKIAMSGRKGPVLLDIPMNIQRSDIPVDEKSYDDESYYDDGADPSSDSIDSNIVKEVLDLVKGSFFPLILLGGGCTSVPKEELISIAEHLDAPVVVSLMGKDSFPHDHRLFGGFIGSYGNRFGNILLAECELLIVLGSRLDSRQTGNITDMFNKKRIIWVDIDPNEINCSRIKPMMKINADVRFFVKSFSNEIKNAKVRLHHQGLSDMVQELKASYAPVTEPKRAGKDAWHYEILDKISSILKDDDAICVDVGQNQMLAAQVIRIREGQRFINSGGMAPMGYALPAGIGISKETGKRCIVICGDGGLQMNIQELNALKNMDLDVIIVVLNNHSLGMIKQFQELYFDSRYFGTQPDTLDGKHQDSGYHSCDFVKIAEAFGIKAFRFTNKDMDFGRLKEVFEARGPSLIELDMDYDTHIYPKLRFDRPLNKISPELSDLEEKFVSDLIDGIKN